MGEHTKIEWAEASWTPIRARNKATGNAGWFCEHVTSGCEHCYAETMNARLGTGLPFKPGHRKDVELFLDETMLVAPLRWKRPRRIFVCSMTDLFADFVPDEWIERVFIIIAQAPHHTFQILTKRAKRMRDFLMRRDLRLPHQLCCGEGCNYCGGFEGRVPWVGYPMPNVWLGVSCEDQTRADERVPDLLATPAAVRFVSAEPLLGPVNLADAMTTPAGLSALFANLERGDGRDGRGSLHWVICGGESGPGARPMRVEWALSIVEQCATAGVACFVKQLGPKPIMSRGDAVQAVAQGAGWDGRAGHECGIVSLRDRKGGDMQEWPSDLRVRQFPETSA